MLGTILALSCLPTGRLASAYLPMARVLGTSQLPTGTSLGLLPIWNLLGLSYLSTGTAPGISCLLIHSPAAPSLSSHWYTSWTIIFSSHSCSSWDVLLSFSHLYSSWTLTVSSHWYNFWCDPSLHWENSWTLTSTCHWYRCQLLLAPHWEISWSLTTSSNWYSLTLSYLFPIGKALDPCSQRAISDTLTTTEQTGTGMEQTGTGTETCELIASAVLRALRGFGPASITLCDPTDGTSSLRTRDWHFFCLRRERLRELLCLRSSIWGSSCQLIILGTSQGRRGPEQGTGFYYLEFDQRYIKPH